jgi:hypothetical protein
VAGEREDRLFSLGVAVRRPSHRQPATRATDDGIDFLRGTQMKRSLIVVAIVLTSFLARAESVTVKYRGYVDLSPFECTQITGSSFVNRVCYDKRQQYMLIQLGVTYYHYCAIDSATVSSLLNADSKGRFYNANIKSRFDCRITPPSNYP